MWTFKNVFALGLFLFGTTFLWMTASMAGKTPPPERYGLDAGEPAVLRRGDRVRDRGMGRVQGVPFCPASSG